MVGILTERARNKNTLRVARWRAAGTWKSRFPDELVHIEKRLSWEFWYDKHGTPAEAFRLIAEAGAPLSYPISFHLPHKVALPAAYETFPNKWLCENLSGVWQYFMEEQKYYMFFEFPEDAFHYKMAF